MLTTGVAMLLSALFVRFRDISPIWEVLSQILFYSSPVILPAEAVREELAHGQLDHFLYHLYTLNPLVAIFQQFRHAMINHSTLSAGQIMGSWAALLEPLALVAVDLRRSASGSSTARRRTSPRTSRRSGVRCRSAATSMSPTERVRHHLCMVVRRAGRSAGRSTFIAAQLRASRARWRRA